MDKLPIEILTIICKYSGISSIANLASTSRRNYIVCNPILYKRDINQLFPKQSCLVWAAEKGVLGTFKQAIAHGADIDEIGARLKRTFHQVKRRNGSSGTYATPFHCAIKHGHHHIAKWLLERNININVESFGFCDCRLKELVGSWAPHWYPLHVAIYHSDEAMLDMLLRHGARFAASRIPGLHNAAASGSIARIRKFLDLPDFDPTQKSFLNTVALHHVAQNTTTDEKLVADIVRLLYSRGVPLHPTSLYGTPLYCLLRENRFEAVLALLDLGAPVEFTSWGLPDGFNILHQCLAHDHGDTTGTPSEATRYELVSRFLSTGIDIEARSAHVRRTRQMTLDGTPLFFAAAYARDIECTRLLLEYEANARAIVIGPYGNEETFLRGLFRIADKLNEGKEGKPFEPSSEMVCLLLSHGVAVNQHAEEESALVYAAERSKVGDHDLLRLFAENASDDNVDFSHAMWTYSSVEPEHTETRGILKQLIDNLHDANYGIW